MAGKRLSAKKLADAMQLRTGYFFRDHQRLQRALTHGSVRSAHAGVDYERFEFLGDRVLGLAVADMLLADFPGASEGELSVRLNALVNAESLAQIADEIGLAELISIGSEVRNLAERKRVNLRADALESLIAVIYLDGGLDAAKRFIHQYWKPRAKAVGAASRDPKTKLQEWAHQATSTVPTYVIDNRIGPDHDPLFTVSVRVSTLALATGTGRSKREAEQHAAEALLVREGVWKNKEDLIVTDAHQKTPFGTPKRSGFVAIIGVPNAGKSTLINQLVGVKVSIVTNKVQTTRSIVRGIATHNNAQIVFVDTPGICTPRRRLDMAMVSTAWGGAKDTELILVLIDAGHGTIGDAGVILKHLKEVYQPKVLVLNKIDQMKPELLLKLTTEANERVNFERTFMVSALTGSGCNDLLDFLAQRLPERPWYYPEDQISDLQMHQLAAEITREKLYMRLHQELPYSAHVEAEKWEEKLDGSVRIEQIIYVERDSQKKIVLGHNGKKIHAIGQAARKEISEILKRTVHLFLFVKVRENFSDDPERYR